MGATALSAFTTHGGPDAPVEEKVPADALTTVHGPLATPNVSAPFELFVAVTVKLPPWNFGFGFGPVRVITGVAFAIATFSVFTAALKVAVAGILACTKQVPAPVEANVPAEALTSVHGPLTTLKVIGLFELVVAVIVKFPPRKVTLGTAPNEMIVEPGNAVFVAVGPPVVAVGVTGVLVAVPTGVLVAVPVVVFVAVLVAVLATTAPVCGVLVGNCATVGTDVLVAAIVTLGVNGVALGCTATLVDSLATRATPCLLYTSPSPRD